MGIINYEILSASQKFYEKLGHKIIDVPWVVSNNIMNITKPEELKNKEEYYSLKYCEKSLVASGEQSFLYMIINGQLPSGRYQTITPCFRHENQKDLTHRKYFMKNELIIYEESGFAPLEISCKVLVDHAIKFYEEYLGDKVSVNKISKNQTDIECDCGGLGKIELGSFGIRQYNGIKWIYGTGCAEPRLSTVIEILKNP